MTTLFQKPFFCVAIRFILSIILLQFVKVNKYAKYRLCKTIVASNVVGEKANFNIAAHPRFFLGKQGNRLYLCKTREPIEEKCENSTFGDTIS